MSIDSLKDVQGKHMGKESVNFSKEEVQSYFDKLENLPEVLTVIVSKQTIIF
jgi:hypothetical protein